MPTMRWETTSDVVEFRAATDAFVRADPVGNTSLITISEMLRLNGANAYGVEDPLLGWLLDDGAVAGAFLHTPPYPLLLGPAPVESAGALAAALGTRALRGVSGPPELAGAVAEARGGRATVRRRERLYRLGELAPPAAPPPGRAVVATAEHRPVLVDWYGAFAREVGEPGTSMEGMVDDRLSHDGLWLWLSEAGDPVALCGHSRLLAGMTRIAPVYTPPEHRGRGYAGALTAAVSGAVRAAGAEEVLLFTDLANPTSNAIYQRIGYVPVDDRVSIDFG